MGILFFYGIIIIVVSVKFIRRLNDRWNTLRYKCDLYERKIKELGQQITELKQELLIKRRENDELAVRLDISIKSEKLFRNMLHEAPLGFPSLLGQLKVFDEKIDKLLSNYLGKKSHPALKAAEAVRIETQKRREAEYESRKANLLLDYYFSVFPDVQEYSNEVKEKSAVLTEAPPKSDDEDMAGRYLSQEEYRNLSTIQRNQLALDRFWLGKKSKLLVGRLYEQYVGYLYERDGWLVEYFGISEGLSDLGRDLICHKGYTTLIVQCKNWSKSKRIYEKHIFQLFGTTYEYMKNNPFETVIGVFYTSTSLSGLARSFAKEFHIELHEEVDLQRFPIIKCNISRNGERIYHLPFDQQYYNTKINTQDGDFYCATVQEAEEQGFRRAYRWQGNK